MKYSQVSTSAAPPPPAMLECRLELCQSPVM